MPNARMRCSALRPDGPAADCIRRRTASHTEGPFNFGAFGSSIVKSDTGRPNGWRSESAAKISFDASTLSKLESRRRAFPGQPAARAALAPRRERAKACARVECRFDPAAAIRSASSRSHCESLSSKARSLRFIISHLRCGGQEAKTTLRSTILLQSPLEAAATAERIAFPTGAGLSKIDAVEIGSARSLSASSSDSTRSVPAGDDSPPSWFVLTARDSSGRCSGALSGLQALR